MIPRFEVFVNNPTIKLLFWCTPDGAVAALTAKLAESFFSAHTVDVFCGGGKEGPFAPVIAKMLESEGVSTNDLAIPTNDFLLKQKFDIVVNLTGSTLKEVPLLGHPIAVHWNLDTRVNYSVEAPAQLRDAIKALLRDFVERGYFDALVSATCSENLILDNIHDGIIAHNLDRRIFFFNRAAEEITGYSRADVVGKDCHDVFPGHFCGGKCLFCDAIPTEFMPTRREIDIVTKTGEKRTVDMSLTPMNNEEGAPQAILASFRDITRERKLAVRVGEIDSFAGIIGRDRAMQDVYELIKDLADVNVPVLIQGESGTGKELVAAAIHSEGIRGNALFVPVNCAALPEALLESELFGHVKGAFTGAVRDKKGRFELADGGTIFLDEIGDISAAMQVKLLRVLQEGNFERVGGENTIQVNVRVVSATNKDLSKEIAAGRFREDLFYRLSVVPLRLPPLRERKSDIPLLVENFLERMSVSMKKEKISISADAMDVMLSYDWPGNIRELQNWLQFALIKCHGSVIKAAHLPPARHSIAVSHNNFIKPDSVIPKKRNKLDTESVRQALLKEDGNRVAAARRLGVSRATLYRFLEKMS